MGDRFLNLREVLVRPIHPFEVQRYCELLQKHHYLGALPKISETLWYVAAWRDEMKIAAGYVPATVRKTSPGFAGSPSE